MPLAEAQPRGTRVFIGSRSSMYEAEEDLGINTDRGIEVTKHVPHQLGTWEALLCGLRSGIVTEDTGSELGKITAPLHARHRS